MCLLRMLVEAEECRCVGLQEPSSSTWLSTSLCNLPACASAYTLCTTVCFCAYLCMGIYACLCMYSCVSACLSVSTPVSEWGYTSLCINTCMYTCFPVHTVLRGWDVRKPVLPAKTNRLEPHISLQSPDCGACLPSIAHRWWLGCFRSSCGASVPLSLDLLNNPQFSITRPAEAMDPLHHPAASCGKWVRCHLLLPFVSDGRKY